MTAQRSGSLTHQRLTWKHPARTAAAVRSAHSSVGDKQDLPAYSHLNLQKPCRAAAASLAAYHCSKQLLPHVGLLIYCLPAFWSNQIVML